MTLKFTTALLATTIFTIGTAFAQNSTPIPKDDTHGVDDGHNHAAQSDIPVKDVAFANDEAPDDHVIGDAKAPITMIVYASVTCPHCSDWFTDHWPAVKKELIDAGKIRFVFREIPTAPAQLSMIGFMMAECAPKEDYFTVVLNQMENQKTIFKQAEAGKAREEFDKIGKLAGLDTPEAIQACLENQDKLAHIHLSSERGTAAKLDGVPGFYINGEPYNGKQDADTIITLITDMDKKGLSKLPTTMP